jgi:catechol 2,3-dioxygenase-like lactoylglutathione lyase family enzyme
MAKWKAAGVPIEPGGNGRLDQAFVTTPDGLRIEILEDKAQTIPIRHHHIHSYVAESDIPKIQAWYAKEFGAKPGMRGTNVAADIPGANFSFSKTDMPTVSTKGHTLDHIGFDVKNLEAFVKKLQADRSKRIGPTPRMRKPALRWRSSMIRGAPYQLNERPNPCRACSFHAKKPSCSRYEGHAVTSQAAATLLRRLAKPHNRIARQRAPRRTAMASSPS